MMISSIVEIYLHRCCDVVVVNFNEQQKKKNLYLKFYFLCQNKYQIFTGCFTRDLIFEFLPKSVSCVMSKRSIFKEEEITKKLIYCSTHRKVL